MRAMRGVPRRRLAAFLPLVVVLTILAFRKGPPLRTDSDPPDDPEAELRFSSITVTSNSVTLEVAWPTNMFPFGTTLDLFTAPTLTSRWEWVEAAATAVLSTSNVFSVSCTDADTNGFFRVSDRSTCALTMSDADCDGIPDVDYEVTMMNGIVPSPLTYRPDIAIDMCVTNALVSWSGHLLAGSPAIDFGTDALRSSFDVDGQYRVGCPDAGADERIDLGVVDTDDDGLTDADEIELYGTDPFRADSDFDGDSDGFEIATGTAPVNPASYLQTLSVVVTNTASTDIPAYVAWGYASTGWETNGLAAFPSGSGTVAYTNDAMLGVAYVKAFSDINGNGAYDEGADLMLVSRRVAGVHSADISFEFGDMDGDGFPDAFERAEGTDPLDASNYCFSLSATFTGVFHTTNSLTAAAKMANEVCVGPFLATNTTFTLAGHVVTTNGGPLVVYFWDDANSNGLREATEAMVSAQIAVTGHEVCVTNRLSRGVFDSDGDGMLDWWEIAHGLSPTNSADALVDDDGDTLQAVNRRFTCVSRS